MLIPADCDAIRLVNRVRDRLRLPITPIPDAATLDMLEQQWGGMLLERTSRRQAQFDAISQANLSRSA